MAAPACVLLNTGSAAIEVADVRHERRRAGPAARPSATVLDPRDPGAELGECPRADSCGATPTGKISMVSSKATTPAAYLAGLPAERRKVIAAVRAVITKRLAKGFAESMNLGMLSYEIPLARYPETYNKQPLMYLALAAQTK
jgi:hypothetical protein